MSRDYRRAFLALGAAVVLVVAGAGTLYYGKIVPMIKAGKTEYRHRAEAPRRSVTGFTFETGSGVQHWSSFKEKIVLIDVWATWCPPCIRTIPYLAALKDRYRDQPFDIIGLSVDENGWKGLNPFLRKRPEINYTVAVPHPALGWHVGTLFDLNPLGEVAVLPTVFVVDQEGKLAGKFVGEDRGAEIEDCIDSLLREQPEP